MTALPPCEVAISVGVSSLSGTLVMPERPDGLVIFAHGSGSSRFSSRNQFVAEQLQRANFATLLFDLLTQEEERVDALSAQHRFDIHLLGERLLTALDWASLQSRGERVGLFGASTGAAAALLAAARRPRWVGAVVSRGGRPDLAGEALAQVTAPTLLIVGGNDEAVLRLNYHAAQRLRATSRLEIVSGATHLFEEPGKLAEVATLAVAWFKTHLRPGGAGARREDD